MYSETHCVPDTLRVSMTHLQLSSHRLRIETGRWTRTLREERLCSCSRELQDEEHVVLRCERTAHLRQRFNDVNSMTDFFSIDVLEMCKLCTSILDVFV